MNPLSGVTRLFAAVMGVWFVAGPGHIANAGVGVDGIADVGAGVRGDLQTGQGPPGVLGPPQGPSKADFYDGKEVPPSPNLDCDVFGADDGIGGDGDGADDRGHPIDFIPRIIFCTSPPDGAIDARQPHEPDGGRGQGWWYVEFTFNIDAELVSADEFVVETDPPGFAPGIKRLVTQARTGTLILDDFIPIGVWTIITHVSSGQRVTISHMPGDVDNDGVVHANDIIAWLDHANGVIELADYQVDIARGDGKAGSRDILRLIDLLNGAAEYDSYIGSELPAH